MLGNSTVVVLLRTLITRIAAPLAAIPDDSTHSPPGTGKRSSGPAWSQMNRTFPTASQPAARGTATLAREAARATPTSKATDNLIERVIATSISPRIIWPFLSRITTGGCREITQHMDHARDGVCRGAGPGPDAGRCCSGSGTRPWAPDELVVSGWRRKRPGARCLGGPENAGDALHRSQQADLAHRRHSQVASGTGALGRESGSDARLRRSLRADGPGRQGQVPVLRRRPRLRLGLWRHCEDDDRRTGAQGLVEGLCVQRRTAALLLHGSCRRRAGCLLPHHARRAGAVLSGERNADADSRLQIHQDQDHLDRRLRLIQRAVLQCDGVWRFEAHG